VIYSIFGDKLPTEMELAKKFSVTRMTVRKALDKLVVEEMVVRKRGQGTFLVSKRPRNLFTAST
jgi:DNA-binding GntR family transcriptional regulator